MKETETQTRKDEVKYRTSTPDEAIATEYAKRTTNTRCAHMGECESTRCGVRYCDFKSRQQAFIAGHNHNHSK